MAFYMIFTSRFRYWAENTLHQLIIKRLKQSNISCIYIWWQGREDGAGCFPGTGLSVDFTQRRTNLKANKVLVKPSSSKSK